MERPSSPPLSISRLAIIAVASLVVIIVWWQFNQPTVTPSLFTIEDGEPGAYQVPLQTPLLIEDTRDLARVTEVLHKPEGERVAEVDLRNNFALLTTTEVCAPYLRRAELVIDGDQWWVGERPTDGDITDLYNLCEQDLVDFHVFEIDRTHLEAFSGIPFARR